jgi:hypothetical protein
MRNVAERERVEEIRLRRHRAAWEKKNANGESNSTQQ